MARISKPPEVRRQEILDTAMELFAEKGYEDTSMADIARRMGVVQGLLYGFYVLKFNHLRAVILVLLALQ